MFATFLKIVWEAAGRLLLLIPIGGAALFAAYSAFRIEHPSGWELPFMTIPLPAMEPWLLWASLFVVGYLVFRLGWIEARRRRTQPNLYFGEPFVQRVQLYETNPLARVFRTPTHKVNVASVPLHNNPEIKSNTSKLERSHITIEFYDKGTKHLIKMLQFGRWADNIQLGHYDSPSSVDPLRYREIEPNDGANVVDIALKYDDDENCCAFNSESWLEPNLKDPKWIVEGTNFDVRVIIKSSNYDDYKGWFEMKNLGKGGSLAIARKP